MKKEKFTNATVFYNCSGENRIAFCTNRNLTITLKKLNRCSWIKDIEVEKYNSNE
jgi:hypothetical protein